MKKAFEIFEDTLLFLVVIITASVLCLSIGGLYHGTMGTTPVPSYIEIAITGAIIALFIGGFATAYAYIREKVFEEED